MLEHILKPHGLGRSPEILNAGTDLKHEVERPTGVDGNLFCREEKTCQDRARGLPPFTWEEIDPCTQRRQSLDIGPATSTTNIVGTGVQDSRIRVCERKAS